MTTYYVAFRQDSSPAGVKGGFILSSKTWTSYKNAFTHKKSVSPSREPKILVEVTAPDGEELLVG